MSVEHGGWVGRRMPFVGREDERAALRPLLEAAAGGRGGAAMIGGEPGVGKTRLCEEVEAEARDRGFLTLVGHCYEMEGGLPYQPFVEVLEHGARVVPAADLLRWLGDDAPEVARLAPVLRRIFPDLPPAEEVSPEEGRRFLLSAWGGFVERVARAQPILLILDDVHWADESSLLLLQHLARRLRDIPAVILCTYRDVELDVTRPLAKALQELVRQRLAQDVLLRALPEQGVAEMIEAVGPAKPPAGLVSLVYRETEGNPFFVEEVVRHLAEEGKLLSPDGGWASEVAIDEVEVPRSVRLVIEQRLARLSDGCRQLLANAAVVGRDFSFEVVGALSDLGPEALIGAIEEAERASLIREASMGQEARYSFTHELFRQTLLGGLSLPRRQRLHLRVAETLERVYGSDLDSHGGELAFHYRQAGASAEPEKAINYSTRAGDAAAGVAAWGEAISHYESALEASENAKAPDLQQRCQALLSLGEARLWDWDARRVFEEIAPSAYELALSLGDRQKAAHAAWLAVSSLFTQFAGPALSRPDYREWAQRLDHLAAAGTIYRVYADLAMARMAAVQDRPEETDLRCLRARALARELDAGRNVMCSVYFTHALFCQGPRFDVTRQEFAREMASLLATPPVNVPIVTLGSSLVLMAGEALRWGDRAEASRILDLMVDHAEKTGAMTEQFGPSLGEALFAYVDGDLERAVAAITRIWAGPASGQSPVAHGVFAGGLAFRPRFQLGEREFPAAASNESRAQAFRSLVLASLGERDEARAVLVRRRALAPASASGAPGTWSRTELVLLIEAAVLVEDMPLTRWFAAPLWNDDAVTTGESHTTMVKRHLGAAAALLGEPERARQYYERALADATEMRFRPEIALTHLGLAELLIKHFPRERHEALGHLDFAVSEFQEMKMRPSLESALSLRERVQATGEKRPTHVDGLSEREVEVLRLIAAGRTNQQIAGELFISLNTVARHVSHIFDKTGATNRADAASYAMRNGLTE